MSLGQQKMDMPKGDFPSFFLPPISSSSTPSPYSFVNYLLPISLYQYLPLLQASITICVFKQLNSAYSNFSPS